jgi:hypothetical protein
MKGSLMIKFIFALSASLLFVSPATGQIISGCGPLTIQKTDLANKDKLNSQIDCFTRAGKIGSAAISIRQEQLKAISKATVSPAPKPVVTPPVVFIPPVPVPTPTPLPATLPPTPMPSNLPPTPAPVPGPRPIPTVVVSTSVGVSANPQVYYGTERVWGNLAYRSSEWQGVVGGFNKWTYPVTAGRFYLTAPNAVYSGQSTKITCTWEGNGKVYLAASDWSLGDHVVTGTWVPAGPPGHHGGMWFDFSESDGTMHNVDCREAGVVMNGRLDQRYVDDMKLYKTIRFMDWSHSNDNKPLTWATRALPGTSYVDGDQPLEDQIEIANSAGADAWFNIPWNADDDYIRNASKLIHDTLKGKAYFEVGNEVWNWVFGVTTQALNEGIAENLSPDNKYYGVMYRYAEKNIVQGKILADVFSDNPARLVRVAAFQSGNTFGIDQFMTFRDTANYVDALADAPYFGIDDLNSATVNTDSLDTLFAKIETQRQQTVKNSDNVADAAKKYGKLSMIYEGGNGTISTDVNSAINIQIQNDPRMGVEYDRYIADLRVKHTGPIMVYNATGPTSKWGSWGQHDYTGAPSFKRDAIARANAQ